MTHRRPTVTVLIPAYQEAEAIAACLDAIDRQTYSGVVETLLVDGGSTDGTPELAAARPGVTVLSNPRRLQAAAMNVGLAAAAGQIVVRVDGHCVIAPDYIERAVAALADTGAVMVGGAMTAVAIGTIPTGIADAMGSRFGAGPARFRTGGTGAWVDTVYLGAYWTSQARAVGGYAEDVGVNEDAEFALRLGELGGVWFEPTIRSTYTPRPSIVAVARQFHRYGRSRARTVRRHPASIRIRQLAPVFLVLALLLLPGRRKVALAYLAMVGTAAAVDGSGGTATRFVYGVTLPTMHLSWASGFLMGIAGFAPPQPVVEAPTGSTTHDFAGRCLGSTS